MARKDDLKMLFNFLIDLLKDEEKNEEINDKQLITEDKPKVQNYGVIDASRIKTIMDKIENKDHYDAVIKKALKIKEDSYKKEIEDLKEAFNKKTLEQDKLEIEDEKNKFSGSTVYSEFVNKINDLKS
jgi:hypothetical protein